MSLPMYGHDHGMGEGFGPPATPTGQGNFASGSGANWATGQNPVPPPPKRPKGKDKYREPSPKKTGWETDSSTQSRRNTEGGRDSNNTQQPARSRRRTSRGSGSHDTRERAEPEPRRGSPKIIKNSDLEYDGTNFTRFLTRFEREAKGFRATDYDKALQIGRFVKKEELKLELEAMDGYEEVNWRKLRKSMIDSWGELDNKILYTQHDLMKVSSDYARNGGLKTHQEYKAYLGKFHGILKYLVENDHIHSKEDASLLFISAFPKESQKNIKRILISKGRIPKAKDGSSKPPLWDHVQAAAEQEIRVEETSYFVTPNFGESNRVMQKQMDEKKGDGRHRERMLEENPSQELEKKVEDMAKDIASLKNQIPRKPSVNFSQPGSSERQEFSRGNTRPSTPLYEPKHCFYCLREGHTTYKCHELTKD